MDAWICYKPSLLYRSIHLVGASCRKKGLIMKYIASWSGGGNASAAGARWSTIEVRIKEQNT